MAELESSHFYFVSYMGTNTVEFNGFKLREALGDMYDKYDKFKIVFNQVLNWNNDIFTNRFLSVKMSGLDWVNNLEYGTDDKTLATLGFIYAGSNGGMTIQTGATFGCVFNKPKQESVNLTIRLFDLIANNYDSTRQYKTTHYFFNVYGVK